ncbi:N-acetyltransferase [bacterium 1XD21-13]|nr:N-acetyltransferase [bacterium 1XD21-13]
MIRAFQTTDLEAVMELWLRGNLQAHAFIEDTYWEQSFDLVKEMLPDAEAYVYENKATSAVEGFIGLVDNSYIAGIFVKDSARSQGIGKQLLDYIKADRQRLTLKVYEKNKRALQFYQREGFQIQSESLDENTGEQEYEMVWNYNSYPRQSLR